MSSKNYKTSVMVMSMAVMIAGMSLVPVLTQQSAVAAIYCSGGACYGTSSDDYMIGSSTGDAIWGFEGRDHIYGFGGEDDLRGGDDGDYIYHNSSASGSDSEADDLYGGSGTDKCYRNTSDSDTTSSCETIINW